MSQGVKPTHQTRSRQTRDKLLNALEVLLKKKDFADISVSEIASEAGVSPASIYRRFDKKVGFIPVLYDLYLERMAGWVKSPDAQVDIEGLSLREALRLIARAGWKQLSAQSHILRAIFIHSRKNTDFLDDYASQYAAMTLATMSGIIAHYQGAVKRADTDRAARMAAYYFNGIFIEHGLFPEQSTYWSLPEDDTAFTDDVADMVYGYLVFDEGR